MPQPLHLDYWDGISPAPLISYNSGVTEDLVMSPIELNQEWISKSPLDFISGMDVPVESVEYFGQKQKLFLKFTSACSNFQSKTAGVVIGKKMTTRISLKRQNWLNWTLFNDAD